jgi:hypothetical protein
MTQMMSRMPRGGHPSTTKLSPRGREIEVPSPARGGGDSLGSERLCGQAATEIHQLSRLLGKDQHKARGDPLT